MGNSHLILLLYRGLIVGVAHMKFQTALSQILALEQAQDGECTAHPGRTRVRFTVDRKITKWGLGITRHASS